MKIAFLCASLEPGRDGVGDYTRGLAGELIQRGHQVVLIALNEPYVSTIAQVQQPIGDLSVSVLRLPGTLPWKERVFESHQWLEGFDPDWISLQFVPFGFHPRGFCFGLGKKLAAINTTAHWHIMFHELWQGAQRGARMKEIIVGHMQKFFNLAIVGSLRPSKIHTSNLAYRTLLQKCRIAAEILPLFGNIPVLESRGEWMKTELAKIGITADSRKEFCLLGIFGAIPSEWPAKDFLVAITKSVAPKKRQLVLLTIGNNSADARENLFKAAGELSRPVKMINFGNQSQEHVSEFLQNLDFGVATTSWCLIGKSGSVAAMLDHGLPILVFRDDVDLDVIEPGGAQFIKMEGDWQEKMWEISRRAPRSRRPDIAGTFLNGLEPVPVHTLPGQTK